MTRRSGLAGLSRPPYPPSLPAPEPSGGSPQPANAPAGRGGTGRNRALRALAVPAASAVAYFVVRPAVGSDAAALAIAGALPAACTIVAVLVRRRVELLSAATAVAFALACVVSLLAGGSSLPLKLHEAAVTFVLGVVLIGTALARHPLPAGRLLKVPHASRALDASLSVMTGSFLVLHSLLHVALALTLSTSAYLTAGRIVSWATLAVGALCLYGYLRRLRKNHVNDQAGETEPPASKQQKGAPH